MKTRIILLIICCMFALSASAQNKEARKIDEFGELPCGHFMAIADAIVMEQMKEPGSKIYVFYYEGKAYSASVWNRRTKEHEMKTFRPRRGHALNRAKELGIYLRSRNFDESNIILVDGGYRKEFILEIWLVPAGAAIPKATPTLEEKDVIFGKGKPGRPRDCSKAYSL